MRGTPSTDHARPLVARRETVQLKVVVGNDMLMDVFRQVREW
jgi:hypothetical protein